MTTSQSFRPNAARSRCDMVRTTPPPKCPTLTTNLAARSQTREKLEAAIEKSSHWESACTTRCKQRLGQRLVGGRQSNPSGSSLERRWRTFSANLLLTTIWGLHWLPKATFNQSCAAIQWDPGCRRGIHSRPCTGLKQTFLKQEFRKRAEAGFESPTSG